MEIDSLVWVKPTNEDEWTKAKLEKVEEATANKQKAFAVDVLLQDSKGQLTGQRLTVTTNYVDQSTSEFELVKLRNHNDENSSDHIDDLVVLSYLHEPAILWSVYQRFCHDIIYTNTGPILLAINPFKNLSMYAREKVTAYRNAGEAGIDRANAMKPHVFKVADGAYRSMTRCIFETKTKADQSILVSGESGAGKTETTKFIMRYLADITKDSNASPSDHHMGVEHLVLQSNPILESFGNARTLRNDNSSRFGKFIEINFSTDGSGREVLCIQKATIRTYLLEKVRLVHQSEGERNYHCFYEYLQGSPEAEKMRRGLTRLEDYKYLARSRCYARKDGVDDHVQHQEVLTALADLEFTEDEKSFIADVVAAVLHLGNVTFSRDTDTASITGEECRIDSACQQHADYVCTLLRFPNATLQRALCEKEIFTREGTIVKRLSIPEADNARDSLAKTLYGALFDWLVFKVNHSIQYRSSQLLAAQQAATAAVTTTTSTSTTATALTTHQQRRRGAPVSAFIGVLDIFGFENFDSNSFEQLCINFTNETLQQHFNQFVFEYEQSLYQKEGINWSFVAFPDNKDTLDLLDNRQKGIFSICDDQGRLGRTTLSSLVGRLYDTFTSHSRFSASSKEKARNQFVIHHYAGPVCYDAQSFLEKNNDTVSQDMIKLLRSSDQPLLLALLPYLKVDEQGGGNGSGNGSSGNGSSGGGSANKTQTLGFQFRSQLKELMQNISTTTPHYIRCIKPNPQNRPNQFDQRLVISQLRCCGVIEAVRVSRAGFPNRYKLAEFIQRYGCLQRAEVDYIAAWKATGPVDLRELVQRLARDLSPKITADENFKLPINLAQAASTTAASAASSAAAEIDPLVVSGVQVGVSMVFLRRNTFDVLELQRASLWRASAIRIQARVRCTRYSGHYRRLRRAAWRVQCWLRVCFAQRVLRGLRATKASILLQRYARRWLCRRHYTRAYRRVVLVQSLIRRYRSRQLLRCLRRHAAQTQLAAWWKRCQQQSRYRRIRSAFSTLQRKLRVKRAKKLLTQLKIEAKSLQKVMTERDLLAQRLRELEEKYKQLEQEKLQQVHAMTVAVTSPMPVPPAPSSSTVITPMPTAVVSTVAAPASVVTAMSTAATTAATTMATPLTSATAPADAATAASIIAPPFSPIVAPLLSSEPAAAAAAVGPSVVTPGAASAAAPVAAFATTPEPRPSWTAVQDSTPRSSIASVSGSVDEVRVSAQEYDRMRHELEESKRLLAMLLHNNGAAAATPTGVGGGGAALPAAELGAESPMLLDALSGLSRTASPAIAAVVTTAVPLQQSPLPSVAAKATSAPRGRSSVTASPVPTAAAASLSPLAAGGGGAASSLQMAQFAKFKQKIEKLEQENQRLKHKVSRASVVGLVDDDDSDSDDVRLHGGAGGGSGGPGDDETKHLGAYDHDNDRGEAVDGSRISSAHVAPDVLDYVNPMRKTKAASVSSPTPAAAVATAKATAAVRAEPEPSRSKAKKTVTEVMASKRPMTTLQRTMSENRLGSAVPASTTAAMAMASAAGSATGALPVSSNPNVIEGENPMLALKKLGRSGSHAALAATAGATATSTVGESNHAANGSRGATPVTLAAAADARPPTPASSNGPAANGPVPTSVSPANGPSHRPSLAALNASPPSAETAATSIPLDYGGAIDWDDSDNEDPNEDIAALRDEDLGAQDFQLQDQKQAWEDYQRSFASRTVSVEGASATVAGAANGATAGPPLFSAADLAASAALMAADADNGDDYDEDDDPAASLGPHVIRGVVSLESDEDDDSDIDAPVATGGAPHSAEQRRTSIFRRRADDSDADSDDEDVDEDDEAAATAAVDEEASPAVAWSRTQRVLDSGSDDDVADEDLTRSAKVQAKATVAAAASSRSASVVVPPPKGEFYHESDSEGDGDDDVLAAAAVPKGRVMFRDAPDAPLSDRRSSTAASAWYAHRSMTTMHSGSEADDDDIDGVYPASRASTVDGDDGGAGYVAALQNVDFSKLLFGDRTLQLLQSVQTHRLAELQSLVASATATKAPVTVLQEPLDAQGRCLLHWAAIVDDVPMLQYLTTLVAPGTGGATAATATVNVLDYREQLPLHYARSAKAVDVLVAAGAVVDHLSAQGQTPLHRALYRLYTCQGPAPSSTTTATTLATVGEGDFSRRVMMSPEAVAIDADLAEYYYDADPVHDAHAAGDPHAPQTRRLTLQDPVALAQASTSRRERWLQVTQALLRHGADPMVPDPLHHQRHALHFAAIHADFDLLTQLFADAQYTLNVDQGDEQENSPILFTVASESPLGGQMKIFSWLVSQRASALLCNERGLTALHLVCANRYLSAQGYAEGMVDMLLGMQADPNALDPEGCTPLIVACTFREWALCKLLLEAGGDMNIPCSMNSIFLQGGGSAAVVIFGPYIASGQDTDDVSQRNLVTSKEHQDQQTMALMKRIDCTASDLMPRQPRYTLFGSLRRRQTRIPGESRDCCMNCGNEFHHASSSFSMFRVMTSGKHHCRHCHRVVCQTCSPKEMPRDRFPAFVQQDYSESMLRVCVVCYDVLFAT